MNVLDYTTYMFQVLPEDALVVSSHTNNTWALSALGQTHRSLLGFNMGFATPLGLGLALAVPHRQVVVLDGDGGVLLLSSALADVASQSPPNLVIVVSDNQSALRFPSHTAGKSDIEAMARGAGIANTATVRTLEEFKGKFDQMLARRELGYIVAKTEIGRVRPPENAREPFLHENKFQFIRHVEETEDITIIRPFPAGFERESVRH